MNSWRGSQETGRRFVRKLSTDQKSRKKNYRIQGEKYTIKQAENRTRGHLSPGKATRKPDKKKHGSDNSFVRS